jgi:hypothetical protein
VRKFIPVLILVSPLLTPISSPAQQPSSPGGFSIEGRGPASDVLSQKEFVWPDFVLQPPPGSGWFYHTSPEGARYYDRYDVSKVRLSISVENGPECNDPQQELTGFGQRLKTNWQRKVALTAFESRIGRYDGELCLAVKVGFDPRTAKLDPPITSGPNVVIHSLYCIYGPGGSRRMNIMYQYRAEGDSDPRRSEATALFNSLRFNRP